MKKKVIMILLAIACISLSACQKTADVIEETVEVETGSSEVVEEETTEEETTDVEEVAEEVTEEVETAEVAVEEIPALDDESYFEAYNRYTNTNVNIRENPDKDSKKVDTLGVNTLVQVTGLTEDNEWSCVNLVNEATGEVNENSIGWVKSSLLSEYQVNVSTAKNNSNNGVSNKGGQSQSNNGGQQAQASASASSSSQSQPSKSSSTGDAALDALFEGAGSWGGTGVAMEFELRDDSNVTVE